MFDHNIIVDIIAISAAIDSLSIRPTRCVARWHEWHERIDNQMV